MRNPALAILLSSCALVMQAQSSPATPPPATPAVSDYQLEMEVKIPLRDGVHLNATIYKPTPFPGPLPVVFMLSPYPDDTSHPSAAYFARHGYIYAYVDVRGRGDSESSFTPFVNDAQDGYDVVEWFARQPWSNGKIAMFGGSYAGGDQWQTAALHPPHLATIAPVASVRTGVDFPLNQNFFGTYMLQWLSLTSGKSLHSGVFDDGTVWSNAAKRMFLAKAPFSQFDTFGGNTSTVFQTWIHHPEFDDFWKSTAMSHDQIAGVKLPVLVITGAADGDQAGTLSFYDDHITSTDAKTLDDYYLVMGPWDHPGTRQPKAEFGGEHYGPASLVDVLRLHREWYDYTMKSAKKPAFLEKHVAFYVSGAKAECWKYADSLAAVSAKSQTYYLDATSGAARLFHSGSLTSSPDHATSASFVSDPNDLSSAPTEDSQEKAPGGDLHGNGLVFHTAPFADEMEIDGKIDLRLSLSIDAPDTDLEADLFLITPDGHARYLTDTEIRGRYRHSLEHAEAIHENQPDEYRFAPGQWFAVRAPKGSQLRLIVSALNNPYTEKNWNSMKPVAEQSSADARIAHIQLLQTKDHPSTLTVPLGDPSATCKASADW